jgi:hypothetical protein
MKTNQSTNETPSNTDRLGLRRFALAAGLSLLLLAAGNASAGTINWVELPNEGGITFFGDNTAGGFATGEVFHVSSPFVPPGYVPDAIASHIGITLSANYYLFDILESAGGPISDQVYVHILSGADTVIDFFSDPSTFVNLTPTGTVVETAGLQFVGAYQNDRGETVSLNVDSGVDAVPDAGSTITLLGLGTFAIGAIRQKLG